MRPFGRHQATEKVAQSRWVFPEAQLVGQFLCVSFSYLVPHFGFVFRHLVGLGCCLLPLLLLGLLFGPAALVGAVYPSLFVA